ncbi:MAG: tRNA guanosine(34) transglycosylase Tgt, partial [Proteobacteria bacterium]|nr:tRNA guanosine(34) transglycosylase Tgt [Pseudomonadota bacterium]
SWQHRQLFQDLMAGLRDAIANDTFDAYAAAFLAEYERGDIEAL